MANNPWYKSTQTWELAKKEAAKMRKNGGVAIIKKINPGRVSQYYTIMGKPKGANKPFRKWER